jgi:hypothetical protein
MSLNAYSIQRRNDFHFRFSVIDFHQQQAIGVKLGEHRYMGFFAMGFFADNSFPEEFWEWVKTSPIAVISFIATYFMGIGIAFMLLRDHVELVQKWKGLYHALGLGWASLVFLIVNFGKILDQASPITIADVSKSAPGVLIISFAALFIVMIISIKMEKKGRRGKR